MYRTYLNANVSRARVICPEAILRRPAGWKRLCRSLFIITLPSPSPGATTERSLRDESDTDFFFCSLPSPHPTPVDTFLPRSFFRIATVLHKRDQDFMEIISIPFGMQHFYFIFFRLAVAHKTYVYLYIYIYNVFIIYRVKTGLISRVVVMLLSAVKILTVLL